MDISRGSIPEKAHQEQKHRDSESGSITVNVSFVHTMLTELFLSLVKSEQRPFNEHYAS